MTKKTKIQMFHVLLYRTHMTNSKHNLLDGYGVTSTKDLSEDELDQLILYLQNIEYQKTLDMNIETRNLRHKVLRQITECGINTKDWNAVNAFMCQPRIAGKHLYECSIDELKSLHRKLHNVAIQKAKQRKQNMLKALMN